MEVSTCEYDIDWEGTYASLGQVTNGVVDVTLEQEDFNQERLVVQLLDLAQQLGDQIERG